MKLFKLIILIFAVAFTSMSSSAQNVSINILTQNSGQVNLNGTVFLEVTICNTDPSTDVPAYKLRPQISVPSIVTIPASGHNLPAGWTITFNSGSVIRLSNGTDQLPANTCRTILIALQGTTVGSSSTISGNLLFSNGVAPGSASGPATSGDNPSDNSSQSTVEVLPAATCNLAVSASAGTITCNGGTTTLTATATGASGAVEYSLNGGAFQPGNTFTVNAAGSPYTVTAREISNTTCTANSSSVTVTQPTSVSASGSVTTPIAVFGGTGTITVTATGGTGAKTYVITSGTTINTTGATSGVFTGLLAGNYVFTATDANSCTGVTSSVALNNPAPCNLAVSASAGTITCNGGTTTLTATATGASGAVEYSLNGGAFQPGNTFTVNAAGSPYTVTAREVSNTTCTTNASPVTVTQPTAVSASGSVTTPIAVFGGTGTITVTATGGTGAKTYVITSGTTINTTGVTSGVFTGLLAGNYVFTATDANSCTGVTSSVALTQPGVPTADPAVGQMNFTTLGGSSQSANSLLFTQSYKLNIPFYNLNQLNNIPNGSIRVRINIGSKLILDPAFNLATAPLNQYFAWTSAVVSGNVVITGTQIAAIPADFSGTLLFNVKGSLSCTSTVSSIIDIINAAGFNDEDTQNNAATLQYTLPVTLSTTQTNVTCHGAGNGTITVTTSPGVTVVIKNSSNTVVGNSNLVPGVYTVTATAAGDTPPGNTCTNSVTVTIVEPLVLTAAVTGTSNNFCHGGNSGSITVLSSGGTSPYHFTIAGPSVNTTGATSGVFTGLMAGVYTITSTDANGCTATTSATITEPTGTVPDISLGSDLTGSFFANAGITQTIVYNVSEIAGNASVGDTIRLTKISGFTINFNVASLTATVGTTTYPLDNGRWKIDNSDPTFVSLILTDPSNLSNPGTISCNSSVNIAITLTRNTTDVSTFTLSARLRKANSELNLSNNLNSIILTAE